MKKAGLIIRGIVSLAVLIFIALVVYGVFTALDSAGKLYAKPTEAHALVALDGHVEKALAQAADKAVRSDGAVEASEDSEAEATNGADNEEAARPSSGSENTPFGNARGWSDSASSGSTPSGSSGSNSNRVWVEPEYEYIHHDAVYETRNHPAEYSNKTEYFSQCNDCSYRVQGSIYPHQDETGHGRYTSDYPVTTSVLVKEAWAENVLVKEAWTEKKLVREGYWK